MNGRGVRTIRTPRPRAARSDVHLVPCELSGPCGDSGCLDAVCICVTVCARTLTPERLGAVVHGAWKVDPAGMSAVIASAEADIAHLNDILRRLDVEAAGAVAVVGGPVAQALDRFLADVEAVGVQARDRASLTVDAARRVLGEYGNADEQMASDNHAASVHLEFQASRFSARVPE